MQEGIKMENKVERYDDKIVVEPVANRIDVTNAQEFKDFLVSLIGQGERELILDLHQVEFMDSTALGVIVSIFKRLKEAGGKDLKLCGLSELVKELFEITRLHKVMKLFPSREEALAG